MSDRQPLVVANWKMNGTLITIRSLVKDIREGISTNCSTEVVICPPAIYLHEIYGLLNDTSIVLGAQDVSNYESGAYTGEISVDMLKDYHCQYVIVGHSERRTLFEESDETVAQKFARIGAANLVPILCVGEQLHERENKITEEVVARQLDIVIDEVGIASFANAVIAYEPVWAIGTGHNATPEQAQEVHAFIRLRLARHDDTIADSIRILYGGSVNVDNASELFSMADVDGGLIGGASLKAQTFLTICQAAG